MAISEASELPASVAAVVTRSEREAWAILASAEGIGPAGFVHVVETHGSVLAVLEAAAGPGGAARLVEASVADLVGDRNREPDADGWSRGRRPLPVELATAIVEAVERADALLLSVRRAGVEIVTANDGRYPARLL